MMGSYWPVEARTQTGSLPREVMPLAEEARIESVDGRHRVTYSVEIPFFGWLWAPLVRRRARRVEAAADSRRAAPHRRAVVVAALETAGRDLEETSGEERGSATGSAGDAR